jgi:hypothetical protein
MESCVILLVKAASTDSFMESISSTSHRNYGNESIKQYMAPVNFNTGHCYIAASVEPHSHRMYDATAQ